MLGINVLIKIHYFGWRTSTPVILSVLQVVAWITLWKSGQWKVGKLSQSSIMLTFACCILLIEFANVVTEFWLYVDKSYSWTDLPSKFPTKYVQFPVSWASIIILDPLFSLHAIKQICFFPCRSWLLQYILTMLIVQDGLVTSSCRRWNSSFVKWIQIAAIVQLSFFWCFNVPPYLDPILLYGAVCTHWIC